MIRRRAWDACCLSVGTIETGGGWCRSGDPTQEMGLLRPLLRQPLRRAKLRGLRMGRQSLEEDCGIAFTVAGSPSRIKQL